MLILAVTARAVSFTVLVYNVENLTAADGKTLSADYGAKRYSRAHLLTKMNNIARVVAQFDEGKGPDVILFQEVERDFLQDQYLFDHVGMLAHYEDVTIEQMIGHYYDRDVARIPVEGLLLKTFYDRGLRGYRVAAADDAVQTKERRQIAHLNIVFSRFPIGAVRSYIVPEMPALLEVQLEVGGYPLYIFNNHWKGDAMGASAEDARVEAAKVLRDRMTEIFSVNPNADLILAGDFNCFYNQGPRFHFEKTALTQVLGSQGDKRALRANADLYNLWYELPSSQRGSEIYHGVWSTFIQMLVSRGLYDFRGVQYVDGSFGVGEFPGLNANENGEPIGWSFSGMAGSGFSKHFPLYAKFITVRNNRPDVYLSVSPPKKDPNPSGVRK
ncbi:MAG: endonuclease/exonuclease/phosphatase family protein [Verrucomicrobia bacterium]|nr:endonuclease/exonuclease/phosphatase family protein [Verrucomicrobiota bacterium]